MTIVQPCTQQNVTGSKAREPARQGYKLTLISPLCARFPRDVELPKQKLKSVVPSCLLHLCNVAGVERGALSTFGCAVCCESRVMELRRRRGDAISDARDSNVEASIAGTIGDNCFEGMSPNPKRPAEDKTEDSFHDGGFTPSGSQTADAVVGAAVRGGSLLMVLALVQVWAHGLEVAPTKLR